MEICNKVRSNRSGCPSLILTGTGSGQGAHVVSRHEHPCTVATLDCMQLLKHSRSFVPAVVSSWSVLHSWERKSYLPFKFTQFKCYSIAKSKAELTLKSTHLLSIRSLADTGSNSSKQDRIMSSCMEFALCFSTALNFCVTALSMFIFITIGTTGNCLFPPPNCELLERITVSPHKTSYPHTVNNFYSLQLHSV